MWGQVTHFGFHWVGDNNGCAVNFKADKFNINYNPPLGWGIEDVKKEIISTTYDVDYYTNGKLSIDQLDLTVWINLALNQIR
jgi:hypothetical protein